MRSKTFISKINLQRGKLTVENRKSREKKRICSEVSVNSPGNPCPSCRPTNSFKALKHCHSVKTENLHLFVIRVNLRVEFNYFEILCFVCFILTSLVVQLEQLVQCMFVYALHVCPDNKFELKHLLIMLCVFCC